MKYEIKNYNKFEPEFSKILKKSFNCSTKRIDELFVAFANQYNNLRKEERMADKKDIDFDYNRDYYNYPRQDKNKLGFLREKTDEVKYGIAKCLFFLNVKEKSTGWSIGGFVPSVDELLIIAKELSFTPQEICAIAEYLNCIIPSPNANPVAFLLRLSKNIKLNVIDRQYLLELLLENISLRGFHHSIVDFKQILQDITKDDIELMRVIRNFKVNNKQDVFHSIHYIFNLKLSEDSWENYKLQRDIIVLLDSASGATPKKSWLNKYSSLISKIERNLLDIAEFVLQNKKYKIGAKFSAIQLDKVSVPATIWNCDIYTRFLKSSTWIQDLENKQLTL